jgi:uncharacterized protein
MPRVYPALVVLAIACLVAYYLNGLSVTFLIIFGFLLAVIDTAFGMGYGTLATPILLIFGFRSLTIVPAVLLSQGVAAGFATVFHVRYKNVDLLDLKGTDAKISAAIIGFGIVGAVAAVALAINLPSLYVKTYIGLLVVAMGLLLIARPKLRFTWPKVFAVSLVNGFDKAISGGSFGPVAVGGLLSIGQAIRNSVGIAVFTVTVVNLAGVVLYLMFNVIGATALYLMATLSVGGVIGAVIGPGLTSRLNAQGHVRVLAYLMIAIGLLALLTTFVKV